MAQMQEKFGDADNYDSLVAGISQEGIDPWWTYGDDTRVIMVHQMPTRIDMSLLYDRYYDRAETISEIAVNLEVSQRTAEVNSNYPVLTSPNNGFAINNCDSTPSSANGLAPKLRSRRNQVLVCGSVEVLVDAYAGCFEEISDNAEGSDSSTLEWNDNCAQRIDWQDAHSDIRVTATTGFSVLCLRLNPTHQVGDAIAFLKCVIQIPFKKYSFHMTVQIQ